MHEKTRGREKSITISRRQFIKATVLAAGAAGALSTVNAVPVKAATSPSKLSLVVSGYKLDRTEALIDGRVQVEGCDIKFEESGIGDINTNVFSGSQTLDVTEIGLHPFMLAYANEGFRLLAAAYFPDTRLPAQKHIHPHRSRH